MKTSRLLVLAVMILALAGGIFLFFQNRPVADTTQPSLSEQPRGPVSPTEAPAQISEPTPAFSATQLIQSTQLTQSTPSTQLTYLPPNVPRALLASNAPPDLPPATILRNVGTAIHLYGSTLGGNPVGTNREITRQLLGENPKQITFLKAEDGYRVNANGELIDPWGSPYFFHQLSATEMEIRSAGPDKTMWTGDDLVSK